MLALRKLLVCLALGVSSLPLLAGCTAEMGDEDDDEHEEEPVGETSDELRSAVSCKERTDTAYKSGAPYSIQVIHIGGKPVSKATGHAFLRMQAAAHDAGVRLSLTSGFRTMAEQRYLYNCYQTKRCNNGNLAARPGYSNHQNGLALDLSTSSWLSRNASRFGFVRTVPKEPWHYEFRGKDPGGPCSRGATTTVPGDEEARDDGPLPNPINGKIKWVAPSQDATLKNGFTVKSRAYASNIAKVVYSQGTFVFGESTDKDDDFALAYTFKYMGDKTLTVAAYDASDALVSRDNVDFVLQP
ncbi:MAG: M15 family metallopeptidase [Labilithrix sp.]|nr:M15 family metallopeptidase [Labilithrix sp.]